MKKPRIRVSRIAGMFVMLPLAAFAQAGDPALPHAVRPPVGSWPSPAAPQLDPGEPSMLVGGTVEKNYFHPWVVNLVGCHGVLIAPKWVLTAAHCISPTDTNKVAYIRHDAYDDHEHTDQRDSAPTGVLNLGAFRHPDYMAAPFNENDIALIELARPFALDSYIQTASLPTEPRRAGVIGAVATGRHDGLLSPGDTAVMRTPIPSDSLPDEFDIRLSVSGAALRNTDSGSGFVTVEAGRAVVRGIAAEGTVSSGAPMESITTFMDVFHFREWIIATMGEDAASLFGNTRVRRTGKIARGVVGVGCDDPNGTQWAALDIRGVELRSQCAPGVNQAVICTIQNVLPGASVARERRIASLTMRTFVNGVMTRQDIAPANQNSVTFFGPLPQGARREFDCVIQSPLIDVPPVLSSGTL